jgi:hypothetical protein
MAFFRKRKKMEEDVQKIKDAVEGKKIAEELTEKPEEPIEESLEKESPIEKIPEKEGVEEPTDKVPVEVEKPIQEEEPKPSFAPLFVKIDRYKSILETINEIKTTVGMIKNTLNVQKQIEDLRNENRSSLESAVDKMSKKVFTLDSNLLRPKGYEEELPPAFGAEGLESVVGDLKKQIESLKSELKTIS